MPVIQRQLSTRLLWFAERHYWRFKYRDPETGETKMLNCTPERFRLAGIDLPNPEVVKKDSATARGLAERLQRVFLRSLDAIERVPEPVPASDPAFPAVNGGQGNGGSTAILAANSATADPGSAIPTLAQAISAFFDLYSKSPSYEKGLRAIFGEFLQVTGDVPLDRVRDTDLKLYERHLAARIGRTSVRTYLRQLGMLIHFGVKKGWIHQDPRLTYRMPKEELKEPNPFSADELAAFFDAVRQPIPGHPRGWSHLEWIGTGLLHLGLRPIELMHARWEDVNFEERFLYVRRSHPNKMPQACQNQPVPLAIWPLFEARAREVAERQARARADASGENGGEAQGEDGGQSTGQSNDQPDVSLRPPTGLVWASYHGEPVTAGVLHRGRESLAKRIPGFQWKRFRKTFATVLEQAGNDVVVVSRLLRQSAGGKNVTMAQRSYIGKSLRFMRQVVDEAFGAGDVPLHQAPPDHEPSIVDSGSKY